MKTPLLSETLLDLHVHSPQIQNINEVRCHEQTLICEQHPERTPSAWTLGMLIDQTNEYVILG